MSFCLSGNWQRKLPQVDAILPERRRGPIDGHANVEPPNRKGKTTGDQAGDQKQKNRRLQSQFFQQTEQQLHPLGRETNELRQHLQYQWILQWQ